MPDDDDQQRIEEELRQGRRFSMEEAMARMAGPGAMKGASPVSEFKQAEAEVGTWLRGHVADPSGALTAVMHRHIGASRMLLDQLDRPLDAIRAYAARLLESGELLKELVREADVEWGRRMDERPHFERGGGPPDPDDPYTLAGVRGVLRGMLTTLEQR